MAGEASFQSGMQRWYRSHGLIAKHLSPPSERGFPDLQIWDGPFSTLIELKVATGNCSIHTLLQPTQAPWAVRWFNEGGFSFYYSIEHDGQFGWIRLNNAKDVLEFVNAKIEDVHLSREKTVAELCLSILSDFQDQCRDFCRRRQDSGAW